MIPAAGHPINASSRLDAGSPVPLYQQLVVQLQSRIRGGEVIPGAFLPGELELAEEFGVSRITAKRALDELAGAGLVKRERGRGTRVLDAPQVPTVRASIEGWLENMGHMQRTTDVRLLAFGYIPAPPRIAEALELEDGAQVQRSVRVRTLDGTPMSYLVCHLPEAIGLTFGAGDLGATPLLKLLERAGHSVACARQSVSATLATPETAEALAIQSGAPLLEVRRIVRDAQDRAIQHIRALYRPDVYRIEMSMARVADGDGMRWAAEGGE